MSDADVAVKFRPLWRRLWLTFSTAYVRPSDVARTIVTGGAIKRVFRNSIARWPPYPATAAGNVIYNLHLVRLYGVSIRRLYGASYKVRDHDMLVAALLFRGPSHWPFIQ